MGVNGIFLAQPVSDGLATLLSLILVIHTRKKLAEGVTGKVKAIRKALS